MMSLPFHNDAVGKRAFCLRFWLRWTLCLVCFSMLVACVGRPGQSSSSVGSLVVSSSSGAPASSRASVAVSSAPRSESSTVSSIDRVSSRSSASSSSARSSSQLPVSSRQSSQGQSSSAPVVTLDAKMVYEKQCAGCHGARGYDGSFSLHNDRLAADDMALAIEKTMPPVNPELCDLTCSKALTQYIKGTLFADGNGVELRKPLVARLTRDQVINSLKDIFGVTLPVSIINELPQELIDEKGFVTWIDTQRMESQYPRAYNNLGLWLSKNVDWVTFSKNLANCSGTGATCQAAFPKAVGRLLFRRPLTSAEQTHYSQLFVTAAGITGNQFAPTAATVVRAMLQSPLFLYRLEKEQGAGTSRDLDAYEAASRLSFFLWQSSPDALLLDAAQAGWDEAKWAAQVSRMIKDARFARSRDTFWADYTITSTAALLSVPANIASELKTSLMATLTQASGAGSAPIPLQQLFTTQEMVFTGPVASWLGLTPKASGVARYNTTTLPERTGFLSHPGFLANIGSTSFVGRGVVLTERVLCREIPEPPVGIETQIDDTATATRDLTPRQAKDYRFGLGGLCSQCHKTFEPIAFAFERFDVAGRYAQQDAQGRNLFTDGYLQTPNGGEGEPYANVAGLMALLSNSDEVSECFVQNMLSFATGRKHLSGDDETISQAHTNYLRDGGTFEALVRSLALHPNFRRAPTVAP